MRRTTYLAVFGALALGFWTEKAQAQDNPDFLWGESGPDTVVRLQDYNETGNYNDDPLDLKMEFVDGAATSASTYAVIVDTSTSPATLYYYDRSNFTGGNPSGDGVYRAIDLNGNGKMDYAEINAFWPANHSDLGSRPDLLIDSAGNLVVACDFYSGGHPGIYVLKDLNGNGHIDLGTAEETLLTGTATTLVTPGAGTISVDNFRRCIEDSNASLIAESINDRKIYRIKDLNGDGIVNGPGEVVVWLDLATVASLFQTPIGQNTTIQSLRVDKGAAPAGRDIFYLGAFVTFVGPPPLTVQTIVQAIDDGAGGGIADNGAIEPGEAHVWYDIFNGGIVAGFIGDFAIFNHKLYLQINGGSLKIYKFDDCCPADGVITPSEIGQVYSGPSAFIDTGCFAAVPDGTFNEIVHPFDTASPAVLLSVAPPIPNIPTPGLKATPANLPAVNPGNTIQFEYGAGMNLASYPFGFTLLSLGPLYFPAFALPGPPFSNGGRSLGIPFDAFTALSLDQGIIPLLSPNPANGVSLAFPMPGSLGGATIYYVGVTFDPVSFAFGPISQVNAAIFN